ncbi:MAG: hypothetical protein K0S68_183 [Candidatus Saccharibacteria bacterium]|jgi:hypothetical protein|nr:hypothetical protein [Candidatus Saccharibacteria bacterium]
MHEIRESQPQNPDPVIPSGQPIPESLISIPPGGTVQPPRRPRKWILPAVIGFFVLGGLAAGAVIIPPMLQKPAANVAATPTPKPTPGMVVYAIKQGIQTEVREWNVEAKASRQLFTFEEVRPYAEDGNLYSQLTPAVDYHHGDKKYAYIAKEGLFIRGLESDPQRLIWATGSVNPTSKLTSYTYDPPIAAAQPDIYGLYDPKWSHDGKHIGFLAGFYEGSQGIAMKVGEKGYTMTKDTVRGNGDPFGLGTTYTVLSTNSAYRSSGLLPDYQVKEYAAALGAQYSSDRKELYAILCPKDLPATGNSKYVVTEGGSRMSGQVDCGETEPKRLARIDLSTGGYTATDAGTQLYDIKTPTAKLLVADSGKVYLPLAKSEDYKVAEFDPATSDIRQINLLQAAKLTDSSSDIIDVRVYARANPTAAIIHKNGDQIRVSLVELTTERALGTFDLPSLSGFSVLGLR